MYLLILNVVNYEWSDLQHATTHGQKYAQVALDRRLKLDVTESFKERLVEEGYNPAYGARPLRRAVMRLLEDSLAEEVLSGRIKDGDKALVDIDENKKVTVNISSEESSQELAGANF